MRAGGEVGVGGFGRGNALEVVGAGVPADLEEAVVPGGRGDAVLVGAGEVKVVVRGGRAREAVRGKQVDEEVDDWRRTGGAVSGVCGDTAHRTRRDVDEEARVRE